MFNNRGIKDGHFFVWPDKNVSVFLEESFVSYKFFRRAYNSYRDFLYDSRFDGNIDFDGEGNIGHVAFFKSIRGRYMVIEPVYMPWWYKIFDFDWIYGVLCRRHKGFLWKKELCMMEQIPWAIGGG
jgi:hypothetical protein